MKGITIKSLIIIVAASLELSSCNVLDINDTSSLSDQAIWSSETAADMYVTASYKTFTDVSQVGNSRKVFYDSYSDLMKSTSYDQYTHTYNKALLQALSRLEVQALSNVGLMFIMNEFGVLMSY